MNQKEFEQYLEILTKNKAKKTPQRIEILRLFLSDKTRHFTADDIILRLDNATAGQATVYRTLELFTKLGILKKINFNNEEFAQFDLVDINMKHFHNHFICDKCHDVFEFDDDLLAFFEDNIVKKYGFRIDNHEMVLRGLCQSCLEVKDNV